MKVNNLDDIKGYLQLHIFRGDPKAVNIGILEMLVLILEELKEIRKNQESK